MWIQNVIIDESEKKKIIKLKIWDLNIKIKPESARATSITSYE